MREGEKLEEKEREKKREKEKQRRTEKIEVAWETGSWDKSNFATLEKVRSSYEIHQMLCSFP